MGIVRDKRHTYNNPQIDLERTLIAHIVKTGKEQIKKRKKAGLSVYFVRNGQIVEVKPDKTVIPGKKLESRWIKLEKSKRSVVLK